MNEIVLVLMILTMSTIYVTGWQAFWFCTGWAIVACLIREGRKL